MKINGFGKLIIGLGVTGALLVGGVTALYLKGLPYAVSHPKVIKYAQDAAKKYVGADLLIENPMLHTELSPNIEFKVGRVYLNKDNKKLLEINNFSTALSFKEILAKKLIIKKLVAVGIYADVNGILKLVPDQKEKKEQKNDWVFDIYDAHMGVRTADIIYAINKDTLVNLHGERIGVNNADKGKRYVYFQLTSDISKNNKHVVLKLNDNKKVFFENNLFHIDNSPLGINNSNIFII